MMTFYNNLPWPVYLLISIGLGGVMIFYFLKNINKYTMIVSIGASLLACSAVLAGVVKIFYLLNLNWHLETVEWLPFIGFSGIPLVSIGAILKTKDDPQKRKIALFATTLVFLSILSLGFIFIFFKQ